MEIRRTQVARRPLSMSSAGFCAFWYVLHEERFRGYEKVMAGFSFDVWDGHPQDAERKIIQDICETHPDFTFLPVPRHRKLKRALHNGFRSISKRLRTGIKALFQPGHFSLTPQGVRHHVFCAAPPGLSTLNCGAKAQHRAGVMPSTSEVVICFITTSDTLQSRLAQDLDQNANINPERNGQRTSDILHHSL